MACGTPGKAERRADRDALRSYAAEAEMLDEYDAPPRFARVHRAALARKAAKITEELR
jgi:hypothetical protein